MVKHVLKINGGKHFGTEGVYNKTAENKNR